MNPSLGKVARILTERRRTATCVEPCIGGLLADALTSIADSSQRFHQGFITYSSKAKGDWPGVMPDTLLRHGAVSREAVYGMVRGIKAVAGADYALSASGITGPGGGGAAKPVGTVWFGLATPTESPERTALLGGSRESARNQAIWFALDWLAENLTKNI